MLQLVERKKICSTCRETDSTTVAPCMRSWRSRSKTRALSRPSIIFETRFVSPPSFPAFPNRWYADVGILRSENEFEIFLVLNTLHNARIFFLVSPICLYRIPREALKNFHSEALGFPPLFVNVEFFSTLPPWPASSPGLRMDEESFWDLECRTNVHHHHHRSSPRSPAGLFPFSSLV